MKKFCLLLVLFCVFNVVSVFASIFDVAKGEFSADGKKLVFQNIEDTVTIWDLETNKEINSINLSEIDAGQIKFLPNGKQIAIFDTFHDTILFYDVASGKLVNSLEFEIPFLINKTIFSLDGQTLVLASDRSSDNEIKVVWFDLNSLKTIAEKTLKGNSLYGNTAKNLIGIYEKETQKFQLFSAKDASEIGSFPVQIEKFDDAQMIASMKGFSAEFSGNGNKIVFANKISVTENKENGFPDQKLFNEIQVYSIPDGKLLGKTRFEAKQLAKYPEFNGSPEISVNQDGTLLNIWDTAGSDYNNRYVFAANIVDINTLKSLKSFTYEETPEETVSFSPNGKTFIKYDENEQLNIFSNDTQKKIATLYPNVNGAEKLAVSADNTKYASVSSSGIIKIWNSQGVLLKKINSETSSAKFIAFSPNGQILVTAHSTK
jgi:WD40 repeat protein